MTDTNSDIWGMQRTCFRLANKINQRQVISNSPRNVVAIHGLISVGREKYLTLSTRTYWSLDNAFKTFNLLNMLSNYDNRIKIVYDGLFLCIKVVDTRFGTLHLLKWTQYPYRYFKEILLSDHMDVSQCIKTDLHTIHNLLFLICLGT